MKFTKEEKEIIKSVENGEWETEPNFTKKKSLYQQYAANTMKKDKRINFRISNRDLDELQKKAMYEGIPYQTYISSILHKFVNDRLIEKV
jgi:predicted DNA binding CopG/RHH family protein